MRSIVSVVAVATLGAASLAAQPPTGPGSARADSLWAAGRWAEAKTEYETFLKAHPATAQAELRAGYAALKLGKPDEAIPYFDAIAKRAPAGRAPAALAGWAAALAQKGDRAKAFETLDRAVTAGYGNYASLDHDEWFAGLRTDPRYPALRTRAERQQMPCLADPKSRAFDFWLGEWDAYVNGTNQLAGRSRIERISGGCAILENWTTNIGMLNPPYEGKSINFFDSASGKWRQVWAGSGQDVGNFDAGEYKDGAMRFTYRRTTPQGPVEGDFIFYNLGPDKVRQFQDQTTDGGKTRQVVYDFIYVRRRT